MVWLKIFGLFQCSGNRMHVAKLFITVVLISLVGCHSAQQQSAVPLGELGPILRTHWKPNIVSETSDLASIQVGRSTEADVQKLLLSDFGKYKTFRERCSRDGKSYLELVCTTDNKSLLFRFGSTPRVLLCVESSLTYPADELGMTSPSDSHTLDELLALLGVTRKSQSAYFVDENKNICELSHPELSWTRNSLEVIYSFAPGKGYISTIEIWDLTYYQGLVEELKIYPRFSPEL